MISAEQFLVILQEKDLLPADLIQRVRGQLKQAESPPTAEVLAEQLIAEGFLTPVLVKRLLEQPSAAATSPAAGTVPISASTKGDSPIFGPTPGVAARKSGQSPAQAEPDELGLAPLDNEPGAGWGAKPVAKPAATPSVVETPAGPLPEAVAAPPAISSLLEEELKPLGGAAGGAAGGSLDRLMGDPMLGGATADGLPLGPPPAARMSWRRRLRRGLKRLFQRKEVVEIKPVNPRQIKMAVITWGVAGALILGGLAALWYSLPPTSEELWQSAQEAYFSADYGRAIRQCHLFLQRFPDEQRASQVRVRLALARIHFAFQQADGGLAALKVAQDVVPKLSDEAAFTGSDPTRKELGLLLADIAEALAGQIPRHPRQRLGDEARAALALMRDYIPAPLRPTVRMAEVADVLTTAENQVNRDNRLYAAVAGIDDAVRRGDLPAAYFSYDSLLKDYADLAGNERLEQAMDGVSRAQQAEVKTVLRMQAAEGEPAALGVSAEVALASRDAAPAGEAAECRGHVVVALAGGAAYGVDAATGKVRWRRLLGRQPSPPAAAFPPQPLATAAGGDVLLVGADGGELWRVAGESGRVVWRFSLGEPAGSPPVVAGPVAAVALPSGRLVLVDLATGFSAVSLQLPQPLHVAPAYDPQRLLLFQVAERSHLYVISLPEGRCRQVVHFGQRGGGVAVPPVLAGDFLVVAQNQGEKEFTLRALSLGASHAKTPRLAQAAVLSDAKSPRFARPVLLSGAKEPEAILQPAQQVRLRGQVTSPLACEGARVLVAAAEGMLYVYDVGGSDPAAPLRKIAESPLTEAESPRRYALLRGDRFWVADTKLARYRLRGAEGRLSLGLIAESRSTFLQPPLLLGTTLISVRRGDLPGVLISALEEDRHDPTWQVRVGAPWPAEPLLAGAAGRLTAVTALGAVFDLDVRGLEGPSVADQPLLALARGELLRPIGSVVAMGGGMFAMVPGGASNQIVLFDPREPRRFRWFLLPESVLACPPIALAGGLLAPCASGRIFLLDPHSTHDLAEPFAPELAGSAPWRWQRPAAVSRDEAVISDGDRRLYRLRVAAQSGTKPRLVARGEAVSPPALASPPAVAGSTVYAVDVAGTLRSFVLPSLEEGKSFELGGGRVWGPQGFGRRVLLATAEGRLLCLGDRQNLLWQIELRHGPLAGPPWDAGRQFVLASTHGVVWRVDAANGEELSKIDSGCPLATGVVEVAGRLFVGSPDGCLYEVTLP